MKIVVGVDGTEQGLDAIALAAALARATAGRVVIAHVYPWDWAVPTWSEVYGEAVREDAQAIVDAAGERLGLPYETRLVPDSSTAGGLHRLLDAEGADVAVLGSSHHGPVGRALVGGVAERVVHGAPCAVAIAPKGYARHDHGPLRRIGVAYDAGPEARAALRWSIALASAVHGELTLYRVVELPTFGIYPGVVTIGYPQLLDDLERAQARELEDAVSEVPRELEPRGEVLRGPVADTLATAAIDQDLMVTGSRGYGRLGTVLLGSVARTLVHHAACPVLVLPRGALAETAPEQGEVAAIAAPSS